MIAIASPSTPIGVVLLLLVLVFVHVMSDGKNAATNITMFSISVVDGDTVRADGFMYRLVGFDTPEMGDKARCECEQTLATAATRRLRGLIADGKVHLQRVACACRAGTEGTRACNYGRRCGVLTIDGRDVAQTMIVEGLARPYVCSGTSCPPRQGWCG